MSSFFKETIKARLFQNKDKYPLLKLNDLLDWSALGDKLRYQKDRERSDRRGNQGYDPLKLFKAVLLGQWHNLSDPELEHALIVRADFLIFCDFDDMEFPDHSTLCRFRQWLIKTDLLRGLLKEINTQLGDQGLKVKAAQLAVIDASIIESSGQAKKKAIEVDKEGHVSKAAASKDSDAQWVKKAGRFYLGYKLHASCDHEGYIENLCVTPANTHESQYLEPLLESECSRRRVLADKGYASKANRALLKDKQLKDGIMYKAARGRKLSAGQRRMNHAIKRYRYVIEQSFGTLKRRFTFAQARYFGLEKVEGQSYLKVMCLNLLKGLNKVSYV